MAQNTEAHEQELKQIVESAKRLGVEIDEADALQAELDSINRRIQDLEPQPPAS